MDELTTSGAVTTNALDTNSTEAMTPSMALDTMERNITVMKDSFDSRQLKGIIADSREIYMWAKRNRNLFSEGQWKALKQKTEFTKNLIHNKEKLMKVCLRQKSQAEHHSCIPSPSKPIDDILNLPEGVDVTKKFQLNELFGHCRDLEEAQAVAKSLYDTVSKERNKLISSGIALRVGCIIGVMDITFEECMQKTDEWLSYYKDKYPERTVEEYRSIILNGVAMIRQGGDWEWLWYGPKSMIPEDSGWKWYLDED